MEWVVDGERVGTLPDLLAPGLRLLFVGYNPSVRAARLGHYYAGRNNRFWDLLAAAGLTPRRFAFEEDALLPGLGIGVTDLVKRPTRSAAELTPAELRAGAERVRLLVAELRPRVVCYNGKGVYLRAAGVARAPWGLQPGCVVPGTADFVAPSPSGLAAIPFAEKVRRYVELREAVDRLANG
ncbi:MAG TPA: mismatch-specific DNA-glycosylase [Longimicrobiaceae bacterium]|nr:mismatch-specific DNA-glycosylase [Longimicrobiaceae bacterium]